MANYNYGRYIAAAIDSLLRQTYADWELIIVDDGSTDDSHRIVERYLADARISFRRFDHLGQVKAKNAGIDFCRGEFVGFLDADDVWAPTKLEKQLALFARQPELGLVYTRRTLIDENGKELPFRQPQLHRGQVLQDLLHDNFICFSSVLIKREVLEHVGTFDPGLDLAIDYDLWLRVAKHYSVDFVDETLTQYRTGHGNLSRRLGERLKTALCIMRRFHERYGGKYLVEEALARRSFAQTCCSMALALRPYSACQSAGWFLRSLWREPGQVAAWRGLVSLLFPSQLRRWLRPSRTDWEQAYRTPENDPRNV
jgi:glycosyltransferase involved in cell wall biosynthesis